jgi:hypothetical protein
VSIKDRVKKILFGLTVPQQYLCISRENLSEPLKTTITVANSQNKISLHHTFVGYKPVVIVFNDENDALKDTTICLHFHSDEFAIDCVWRGFPSSTKSVARMLLSPGTGHFKNATKLKLYEAKVGQHIFLTSFHQRVNKIRESFARKKPGNVDLPGNLHDLVRIAYSLPRTIATVVVQRDAVGNIFPTDLHGQVNEKIYISSLRIGGKAQQQIESVGRIVLAEVDSGAFSEVYALGKNHMKDMISLHDLTWHASVSEKFGFELPPSTLRYFELEILESLDIGIHRIYLYRVENQVELSPGKTLAHIHQYYAEWRKNNGMETNYLLR